MVTLLVAGGLGLYYSQNSGDDSIRQNPINADLDVDLLSALERPVQQDTHDTIISPLPVETELLLDLSNISMAYPDNWGQIRDHEEIREPICFQQQMRGEPDAKQHWALAELQ